MNILNNIIVTDVTNAATVHSPKGRFEAMKNRTTWASVLKDKI